MDGLWTGSTRFFSGAVDFFSGRFFRVCHCGVGFRVWSDAVVENFSKAEILITVSGRQEWLSDLLMTYPAARN